MPAVPKKKHSTTRSRRRGSLYTGQFKHYLDGVSTCPHCRLPKWPQRACPHCGYYKRREVISPRKRLTSS